MRTIEFSLIALLSAFSGGCIVLPAQPHHDYTIILVPVPSSVADSAGDGEGSEEVIPPGHSKGGLQATSGNLSEPDLHPAELLIER